MLLDRDLPPLLLASGSPRRRQLLSDAGFRFEVKATGADEDFSPELPPEQVPVLLAQRKARALADDALERLVIAADTVVIIDDDILNKPTDAAEARAMLTRLSGRRHTVVTGVCLLHRAYERTFAERTEVHFRALSADEIAHYVEVYQPLDKAGAYGAQDFIGLRAIAALEGDFYNVVGLPVCRLVGELSAMAAQLKGSEVRA